MWYVIANATVNKLHDVWNALQTFIPHSPILTSSSHWFLRMHQDKTWHLLTCAVYYMHVHPSIIPIVFNKYCPSWCLRHGRMRTKPCGFNWTHIIKPPGLIECLFCGFKRIVHFCHRSLTCMISFSFSISPCLTLSLLSFLITVLFLNLPFFFLAMRALSCLNLSGAFRGNNLWASRVSTVTFSSHKPIFSFSQALCLCNLFLVDSERLREWDRM